MKFVIAGTYGEYRHWLVQHNYSDKEYRFLTSVLGYNHDIEIILANQYWLNPAYEQAKRYGYHLPEINGRER